MINAIPTRYAGVQFRSRLEARWAAMFDLLRWKWEYEPIDLDGYIPDFILQLRTPVLVEVKQLISEVYRWGGDATYRDAATKIERSGWRSHALIVGAIAQPDQFGELNLGVHWDWFDDHTCEGAFTLKRCCRGPVDTIHSYECLGCGSYDGNADPADHSVILKVWREAGNRVQWRGASAIT